MRLLSFLVYIPLQIVFIPLSMVGMAMATYRQIFVSKRLGTSQTGIEVIGGRWTMHVFGMRDDDAAARLLRALPNASTLGLWLVLFPLWAKYRLSDTLFLYPRITAEGHEGMADLVVARTPVFDRIIERRMPEVDQFVVLGAGYDTRAYGPQRRDGVRCFEVDQAGTQKVKIESLARAGIDAGHVTFVTVDFRNDGWVDRLSESGYDRAKRTLFLWEGVTPYLPEEDVRKTLRVLREHAAPGSVVAAEFYGDHVVDYSRKSLSSKVLEYTGEGWHFGLPLASGPEALERLVRSEGLTLVRATVLGEATKKGALMAIAEMELP